jgi:hypothetical protein
MSEARDAQAAAHLMYDLIDAVLADDHDRTNALIADALSTRPDLVIMALTAGAAEAIRAFAGGGDPRAWLAQSRAGVEEPLRELIVEQRSHLQVVEEPGDTS